VRSTDVSDTDSRFVTRAIEAAVRIGVLFLLVAWCFEIIRPFVAAVAWAIIIATATYPLYERVEALLGGRSMLAAVIFTALMLVTLVLPMVMLSGQLVDTVQWVAKDLSDGTLSVPAPPDSISTWPLVGRPLFGLWSMASQNLESALGQIGPQLKAVGGWMLSAGAGVGVGVLEFLVAIIIAGVMLARAESGSRLSRAIAVKLAGDRGPEFADLAQSTVRSVARGIIGVALIQSIVALIGFTAVGLPAAGLLALICLLLAVIQIGIMPVVVPAVIYVFSVADPLTAGVFAVWCGLAGMLDNVLKPILLGRGVKVPMVVIFVGAIGGFIASGIIGLFVGAVVLALGYTLIIAWLNVPDRASEDGAALERPGAPPPK
jgi:predicted PurR-regulated permease PerM